MARANPLKRYKAKRDFDITPEPQEDAGAPDGSPLQFVVHKHWARRLHYDLRIELDGAMQRLHVALEVGFARRHLRGLTPQ